MPVQPPPTPEVPRIDPVVAGTKRPFWSVMIPTYQRVDYLEQALRGVLDNDPGPDRMQIEVVDNCSTSVDVEGFVRRVGGGRVEFFRQERNLGMVGNWNTCLQRARGHWIHLLNDDDVVFPGFYQAMGDGIAAAPRARAAFCRHVFIDESGRRQCESEVLRPDPGLIEDFVGRIFISSLVQISAAVLRREAVEQLGGFRRDLIFAPDWEMWRRIATAYLFWYDPRILAAYRQHAGSETNRLSATGESIPDLLKSIEICRDYLPADRAQALSGAARDFYAHRTLDAAQALLHARQFRAVRRQLVAALTLSRSGPVLRHLFRFFRYVLGRGLVRLKLRRLPADPC